MISLDYSSRQLAGVWKMAWNRSDWAETLDRSVDGVFRSFAAFAFAAPVAIAGFLAVRIAATRIPEFSQSPLLEAPIAVSIFIELAAYGADWTAGLTALVFAARALGASKRIGDIIIGYNWLQVLVAAAQTIPLIVLGFTRQGQISALFALPAAIFIIALYWGVLRRSTNAGGAAVVGLFALLAIVGFLASSVVASLGLALYKTLS